MFPFFPYTNFHRLNADWILKKVQELADNVSQLSANVSAWASRIQNAEDSAAAALADAQEAVRYTEQELTTEQQTQARANIAAAAADNVPTSAVLYTPQELTETQQLRARLNIGATSQNDVVLLLATKPYVHYDEQTLTTMQKTQARANIGAAYSGDVTELVERIVSIENETARAIKFSPQSLTDVQKIQARANIAAGSAADLADLFTRVQSLDVDVSALTPLIVTFSGTTADGDAACDKTWAEISAAITAGKQIIARYTAAGNTTFTLTTLVAPTAFSGYYQEVADIENPGDAYSSVHCSLTSNNVIYCGYIEV